MFRPSDVRKQSPVLILLTMASALFSSSCGYSKSGGTYTPPPPGSTAAVINVTDAPSDRVTAFELTINSLSLVSSSGSSVMVLNTPRRVEVTHSSGSAEPLSVSVLPQGTFTSAIVAVSNPDVTFIDAFGNNIEKQNVGTPTNVTIPFNPPLVVGSTPVVLTIDFNAAGSIQIDTATNRVTVSPVATLVHNNVPGSAGEMGEDPDDGEFEHLIGLVTGISGNNFTVDSRGTSITFATDSATEFNLAAGITGLPNQMVRVEARTMQNGLPYAKEVEVISAVGGEVEGLIAVTTGSPVTSFSLVVQDASGPNVTDALLGGFITANINPDVTRFRIDNGDIDLGGLNVPDFNATSLSKGQSVEVDAVENSSGSQIVPDSVKLQSQALTGVISNASSSQFTLAVADDSAFKLLTGIGTLMVLTQRNTELKNNVTIANGTSVKVRGLVFFDPSSNSFTMVAGRISTP
jgi:uncharacterized protein DUF5666/uncharacterized protein DUF4382